jgi:hypothetical protein
MIKVAVGFRRIEIIPSYGLVGLDTRRVVARRTRPSGKDHQFFMKGIHLI